MVTRQNAIGQGSPTSGIFTVSTSFLGCYCFLPMDPPTAVHRQSRECSASDAAEENNHKVIDNDNYVIDDGAVMPMNTMQPALTLDEDAIMVRVCLCVA